MAVVQQCMAVMQQCMAVVWQYGSGAAMHCSGVAVHGSGAAVHVSGAVAHGSSVAVHGSVWWCMAVVWQCTAVMHDSGVVLHGSGARQWCQGAWQRSGSPWQWCGRVWQWCSNMWLVWCDSCRCPAEHLTILSPWFSLSFHHQYRILPSEYLKWGAELHIYVFRTVSSNYKTRNTHTSHQLSNSILNSKATKSPASYMHYEQQQPVSWSWQRIAVWRLLVPMAAWMKINALAAPCRWQRLPPLFPLGSCLTGTGRF